MREHSDEKFFLSIVYAFVLSAEAKCPFLKGHSERVTQHAVAIGRRLGLSSEELKILYYVGLVHDIGKIAVPEEILNKSGKLTDEERHIIELHPVVGEELLVGVTIIKTGIAGVRNHHERYDGNGYPDKLKGEDIPLIARIISCADAFDAMVSVRPYHLEQMSAREATLELNNNVYAQFDARAVDAFTYLIGQRYNI